MANHARGVVLSTADRGASERILRCPSEPSGVARRARVILLLAEQTSGAEVARETGYTPVQVSRIRTRFCEEGIAGLAERPRSGRPPAVTARNAARVVALTLKKPPAGLSQWSTREMAEHVGLSPMTVHRIWQAHALKPHRLQTFKFTTDPRAEEKIRDVIGLYANPPADIIRKAVRRS
jgi:transposase